MSWLYDLAQPFVWHPGRALLVALAWLAVAFSLGRAVRRPLAMIAIAWRIFAALELIAWRERADIRVDLIFTWPAVCVITLTGVIMAMRRSRALKDLS